MISAHSVGIIREGIFVRVASGNSRMAAPKIDGMDRRKEKEKAT